MCVSFGGSRRRGRGEKNCWKNVELAGNRCGITIARLWVNPFAGAFNNIRLHNRLVKASVLLLGNFLISLETAETLRVPFPGESPREECNGSPTRRNIQASSNDPLINQSTGAAGCVTRPGFFLLGVLIELHNRAGGRGKRHPTGKDAREGWPSRGPVDTRPPWNARKTAARVTSMPPAAPEAVAMRA